MKRLLCLLLCIISLCCSCGTREGLWGTYTATGGNKKVEFAYSKVFYTLDIAAAEQESEDEESEAVIEGWYDEEDDRVVCTFKLTDGDKTLRHVYTFRVDGDTLTLAGHTVDGEDMPFEEEEYTK